MVKVTLACQFCGKLNTIDATRHDKGPKCAECGKPFLLDRPVKVADENFDATVLKSEIPVLVDFYADWCGPCRTIAPHLEELANGHPDVVLLKIDIVAWGTPVADQFGINSIPNVRVFDRTGRQIGEPTSSFGKVQAYVSKAVQ